MQQNVQFSLIEHLKRTIGVNVLWVFDGMKKPIESDKPYMDVEQMMNGLETVDKMREAIEITYRFQIGLYAQSSSQRATMQGDVTRTLIFDKVNLLDTSVSGFPTVGTLDVDVTAVTPISPENIEDKSNYHRVYFDVEVEIMQYKYE